MKKELRDLKQHVREMTQEKAALINKAKKLQDSIDERDTVAANDTSIGEKFNGTRRKHRETGTTQPVR